MLLGPAATAGASACANADLVPNASNLMQVRTATHCLINAERAGHGRKALTSNPMLTTTAASYAQQMVRERFFDHVSPAGTTLTARVKNLGGRYLKGSRGWTLGENLAWGTGELATAAATVTAWMESPGHRRNILEKRFQNIGIGLASGAPEAVEGDAATYTAVFGQRSTR